MRIWTRTSALMQPRTRLGKSDAEDRGDDGHDCGLRAYRAMCTKQKLLEALGVLASVRCRPFLLTAFFRRLVLGWIEADFRVQIRILSHFLAFFKIYKKIVFSRANLANFCKKFCENFDMFSLFWRILQNVVIFSEILKIFAKFCRIFCRILQKSVDFEKC